MSDGFSYSMVTTVFNDKEEIIDLIKELENQTLKPVEFIIVDGGSNDDTPKKIREYAKFTSLNIRVIEAGRLNIAQGFNLGIKSSVCDYIGIVACGNHYPTDFFECLARDLEESENAYSAYGAITGNRNTKFSEAYTKLYLKEDSLEKFPTNHGNLTRKELFRQENYFYEKFRYAGEDQEFFVRALQENYKFTGDRNLVIKWDVPENIQQYIKQQKGYIVSDMEMYDNKVLFDIYWGRVRYASLFILMVVLFIIPVTRYIAFAPLAYFIWKNLTKLIKYGVRCMGLFNFMCFFPIYVISRNLELLKRENKIDRVLHSYL